jgi:flagellar biosynthesis/type III secretory pathway M-ring protein FliF/YscJ
MNDALRKLFEQVREASLATKATFAALLLGALGVAGLAVAWSNRPQYEILWQDLSDSQFAAVAAALAEAGIDFQASNPPGPFVVYADKSKLAAARRAMFQSSALSSVEGGILTEGSVFMSSGEREQAKRKREWAEMEQMLETLDFVRAARVKTHEEAQRGFGARPEITGSVTLTLTAGHELERDQARTVAKLVRFGLGIESDKLVITNQLGSAAFDGEDLANGGSEWSELAEREEQRLERKANSLLADVLGPGRARVAVRTEWDQSQATTVAALTDPKQRATVYEESRTSSTPQYGPVGVGGFAGSAGNLIDPATQSTSGSGSVDLRSSTAAAPQTQVAETNDSRAEYEPSKTVTQTVRNSPELARISVSLFLDASLENQREMLERAVKAAVGFVDSRDNFESALTEFYSEPAVEGAEPGGETPGGEAVALDGGPDPMVELLLTRGVEIVSALGFVILLFVSLRGARSARTADVGGDGAGAATRSGSGPEVPDEEIDPELLAIRQVEQLLESDPERVGRILSSWAREHGMARL